MSEEIRLPSPKKKRGDRLDWLADNPGSGYLFAEEVRQRVCELAGITLAELDGPTRPNRIAHPRMLAMYVIHRHTRMTLVEIGQLFNRDHGTVIHARKRIQKAMKEDRGLCDLVERLGPGEDPRQMRLDIPLNDEPSHHTE